MMYARLSLCILSILLLASCQKKENSQQIVTVRPVKVEQVKSLATIERQYTGIVQATDFSILAFKVAGTLTELNVEEGQNIKKDQLIAQINPYDYERLYNSAQSNFKTAKAIYQRSERLLKANATATQNVEIAQADYIQAGAAENIARSTLDYTRLTAPFDGIIEKKYVANFEEVLIGQSIVKLVNPNKIEILFILPETSIELLRTPKTIYVEFDTKKGKLFISDIKEYIYSSDGSGIPITLEITDKEFLPYQKDVFPGFSCKVTFRIQNTVADQFIIPASALFWENEQEYLWIVEPENLTVRKQPVKTVRFDNEALVKTGLNRDDLIVTAGVQAIKEKQKVTILQ